jgi:hypothetical protein
MKLAMKPATLAALKKRGVATVGDLRLVNDNTLVKLIRVGIKTQYREQLTTSLP